MLSRCHYNLVKMVVKQIPHLCLVFSLKGIIYFNLFNKSVTPMFKRRSKVQPGELQIYFIMPSWSTFLGTLRRSSLGAVNMILPRVNACEK